MPLAAEVDCPAGTEDYVTAGIVAGRLYFNDGENPDASPTWGCLSPFNGDPGYCSWGRTPFAYHKAANGLTSGGDAATQALASAPVSETWRFQYVYWQVKLDNAYTDGEALHGAVAGVAARPWHLHSPAAPHGGRRRDHPTSTHACMASHKARTCRQTPGCHRVSMEAFKTNMGRYHVHGAVCMLIR